MNIFNQTGLKNKFKQNCRLPSMEHICEIVVKITNGKSFAPKILICHYFNFSVIQMNLIDNFLIFSQRSSCFVPDF